MDRLRRLAQGVIVQAVLDALGEGDAQAEDREQARAWLAGEDASQVWFEGAGMDREQARRWVAQGCPDGRIK